MYAVENGKNVFIAFSVIVGYSVTDKLQKRMSVIFAVFCRKSNVAVPEWRAPNVIRHRAKTENISSVFPFKTVKDPTEASVHDWRFPCARIRFENYFIPYNWAFRTSHIILSWTYTRRIRDTCIHKKCRLSKVENIAVVQSAPLAAGFAAHCRKTEWLGEGRTMDRRGQRYHIVHIYIYIEVLVYLYVYIHTIV